MTLPARKSLSKRLRFAVFDRDGFTCQYCGQQPPDVILHVDHIIAVSNGGTDDPENLRTSCRTCNLGKANKAIGGVAGDKDAPRRAQEALEAVDAAKAFRKAAKARQELRNMACNLICDATGRDQCNKSNVSGVYRAIIEFGSERVMEWIDTASSIVGRRGLPNEADMMRYFFGIIRNRHAEDVTNE